MKLTLKRVTSTDEFTFGVLIDSETNIPLMATLELPWKENGRGCSCVPTGTYTVANYSSSRFKDCFELKDVTDREKILIHTGNITAHTYGCILVGMGFGEVEGKPAVVNSRSALQIIKERTKKREFVLDIVKES